MRPFCSDVAVRPVRNLGAESSSCRAIWELVAQQNPWIPPEFQQRWESSRLFQTSAVESLSVEPPHRSGHNVPVNFQQKQAVILVHYSSSWANGFCRAWRCPVYSLAGNTLGKGKYDSIGATGRAESSSRKSAFLLPPVQRFTVQARQFVHLTTATISKSHVLPEEGQVSLPCSASWFLVAGLYHLNKIRTDRCL